ncbi:MAG: CDP-alcohol phosphatidyltransferase family protein, partial [Desulfotignum sp.]
MMFPNRITTFASAILFSLAAITDYLDGYLARKRGLVTTFGRVMDPVADKLLVSTTFIMLTA